MSDYISAKEAARIWDVTERSVTGLCRAGRIEGCVKKGRGWWIPADAGKPEDRRVRSGAYRRSVREDCRGESGTYRRSAQEDIRSESGTYTSYVYGDRLCENGVYGSACEPRLPLPVGVSDYRLASTEHYYIDKTLLIRDILDERPMVSLFTRPRRFGKTLNMDMLRTFFERTKEDTSRYFTDKKIWACGERYRAYQGRYPVIFISFKDVKYNTWEETFEEIGNIFVQEYKRHREILVSERIDERGDKRINEWVDERGDKRIDEWVDERIDKGIDERIDEKVDKRVDKRIDDPERIFYEKILSKTASVVDLSHALEYLSQMLHEYYGECAVVIVDEYDTPIQQGHTKGFYDEVIGFMRNLLSGCFKDNRHLAFGFMTGILRVAKESIFSGLNNIVVNSVLDQKYSEYFGFTADEVREMAAYYGRGEKFEEVCEWYDGYRFGDMEIFNPWSVVNYFSNRCEPRAFWLSTGSNEIIGEVMREADDEMHQKLLSLVSGGSFVTYIDTSVIYPQIRNNPSSLYSFLLVAGYLKVVRSTLSVGGDFLCEVALPNKEISLVYRKEILQKFEHMFPQNLAVEVQEAVFSGDGEKLAEIVRKLLLQSVSSFDTGKESFYHGFMLGICALLGGAYATSNRESGAGRYDIQLCPEARTLPGIIIELKAEKGRSGDELRELAEAALRQIEEKRYDAEMLAKGVRTVYKYGVAFSGKSVEVVAGCASGDMRH